MFKDILLTFFTFFITTWIVTYVLSLFVRMDWRIHRPLRTTIVFSLLISFIGLNINLSPALARWIDQKVLTAKPIVLNAEESNKMKNDFLTSLEQFIAQPDKITAQNRNELFEKYKALFPQPQQDLANYFTNIAKFYDCQQSFYEDALQAIKTKKIVKSERRKACHESDGSFFGRQNMIPPQQAKTDDEVVESLAKGKKIMREGKEVSVSEEMLKQSITLQQKNKELLRAIFTGGQ